MSYERWAVYSAKDHLNLNSLIVDLILYDRIVIPVPANEETRIRWTNRGWDPKLQEERLKQIGKELYIEKKWDEKLKELHDLKLEEIVSSKGQLNTFMHLSKDEDQNKIEKSTPYNFELISLNTTTELLSNKKIGNYKLPKGVTDFDLIAPYYNQGQLQEEIIINDVKNNIGEFGILLESRLAIPQDLDNEKTLEDVIELVNDKEFRELRKQFYRWQKELFKKDYSPREVINEVTPGIDELNKKIKSRFKRNIVESIFTFGGVGISVAGTGFNPFSIAGGIVCLAKFALIDKEKISNLIDNSPFAVFYDLEKNTDIKLI